MPKLPKAENQPSLFEAEPSQPIQRPFSLPNIFLGTSSFTATGWEGSFYPIGIRSKDFLRHCASQFQTVEIDSTFYGTPAVSTVTNWNERTPLDFIFAVKVPQVITHEKVLVGCEPEFDEFIERMHLLGDKLGPMLLQFPKFDKWVLKSPDEFRARFAILLQTGGRPEGWSIRRRGSEQGLARRPADGFAPRAQCRPGVD